MHWVVEFHASNKFAAPSGEHLREWNFPLLGEAAAGSSLGHDDTGNAAKIWS